VWSNGSPCWRPIRRQAGFDRISLPYAASDNGQRFLFNAVVPDQTPPTITVVQNWTPPNP